MTATFEWYWLGVAFFNVVGGDRDGSTVTEHTLREIGAEVPYYPDIETWWEER